MKKNQRFIDRVGETHMTKEGHKITITKNTSNTNCTIQFEDGTILENKEYRNIKEGKIKKPFSRVGERHNTNECGMLTIVADRGTFDCDVQFDGYSQVLRGREYGAIKKGQIRNPYEPRIYGVGYTGEGRFKSTKSSPHAKIYYLWTHVLERCYSIEWQKNNPTYKMCSVDEKWHNFQNFAIWYEENFKPEYMEGWHLDKDIIIQGNKIYSSETCMFAPNELNALCKSTKKSEKGLLKAVVQSPNKHGKFFARIGRNNKRDNLCMRDTQEESFLDYKINKEREFKKAAEKWKDKIPTEAYEALKVRTVGKDD